MNGAVLDFNSECIPARKSEFVNLSNVGGDILSAISPSLPSILRKENRRFLMDMIDTTVVPDFASLTDICFDHDIHTAIDMISSDVISGMEIGRREDNDAFVDDLSMLNDMSDIVECYRVNGMDESRFGNTVNINRFETEAGAKRRRMVGTSVIHPGKIKSMKLSPKNTPMWWSFAQTDAYGNWSNKPDAVYLDEKYRDLYALEGINGEVFGPATDVVHFKGTAPVYQTWGVGIGQIAKLLIEAKLDMLVDFSKIIKREAGTREVFYVNTTGLGPTQRQAKIDATIAEVNKQRKLGSILVLEKNEMEFTLQGSEGKVLDNFSLHYRDAILEGIRVLTRIPAAFWLGESTNKASIDGELIVYNRFINVKRWNLTRKYRQFVFKPYLESLYQKTIPIKEIPWIKFDPHGLEPMMDSAVRDDIMIRNGSKSRRQVAEEWNTRLPEEDGETPPDLSGKSKQARLREDNLHQEVGGYGFETQK